MVRSKTRIQVIVAGFNRSLSYTHSSIERFVLKPLARFDPNLSVTYVLSQSHEVARSLRTGEVGPSETDLPIGLIADSVRVVEQDRLDDRQAGFLGEILALAQPPKARDRELITNLVRFLGLLELAHEDVDSSADYVFFTRPDLLWLDPLRVNYFIRPHPRGRSAFDGYATANWGGGKAPNDRFALLSQSAVRDYFTRKSQLPSFLDSKLSFGSEAFLGFAMRGHKVYPDIRARAVRVRIGGEKVRERFKPSLVKRQ